MVETRSANQLNQSEKHHAMNEKISALRTVAEKYKKVHADGNGLESLGMQLQGEAKAIFSHLSDLPSDVLALPQSGAEHFPAATAQKLRSLASVRTKLELLPGVKAKQQRVLEEVGQQVRAAAKALLNLLRDAAGAKMETTEAELAAYLLPHCGGDADRAKVQAARAMRASNSWEVGTTPTRGCEPCKWYETFAHYTHAHDPAENAEALIDLAERFDRGEPCT